MGQKRAVLRVKEETERENVRGKEWCGERRRGMEKREEQNGYI